jgi:HAD superfamily hydrolase (TIGR01490 family)
MELENKQGLKILVVFDLDHTLIDVDSEYMWGKYIVENNLIDESSYADANEKFNQDYMDGTLDALEHNKIIASILSSFTMKELQDFRELYVNSVIKPNIRPKALSALQHHTELNHTVLISSATNDFLVPSITDILGISKDNSISTPLEIINNSYSGQLLDKPNYQEGKIYHLNKWLNNRELEKSSFDKIYAYSDSVNDLALLQWADIAICVSPDEQLKGYALKNNWLIENWSL